MKEYLASKYMSGPKADAILARSTQPPKKKKRKALESESSTSSLIKDDDGGWGKEKEEDEFANEDMVIEQDRSFKKKKSDRWQTVREPTPPPQPDEQPMVVDTEGVGTSTGMPLTGGLLTSAQLRQTKAPPPTKLSKEARREEEETVYRDASGRKIDTKAARAEASRVKREKEEMEAKKMEWGKGLVQREEEERRKLEEEKERNRPLARCVYSVHIE
jgi:pre-mRNA-splicing factor CWC26